MLDLFVLFCHRPFLAESLDLLEAKGKTGKTIKSIRYRDENERVFMPNLHFDN